LFKFSETSDTTSEGLGEIKSNQIDLFAMIR
jgi:hypothetical protein